MYQVATPCYFFLQRANSWFVLHFQASQAINEFQFATTTVTIQVGDMSKHVPVFEETRYSGLVSGVGSMVLKKSGENMPMIIRATDADFADVT